MQHDISISVINNSVGQPQQSNGIMMLFMQAVAVAGTFSLNQPYLITSPTDAANLGINAAYDTTNGTAVFQQINEYYNEGGTGKLLWIVGVPLNTAYAAYVASATFDAMIAYTAQADPANRAKIIGLCYAPPTTLQSATDFPADVLATLPALQAKYLTLFALGYQFSAVVDGYNMSSTVTPATIGTLATMTNYAISLCITGTQPNGVSAVGLCLGRFSKISIGHGLGAVADGSVNTTTAYLTNSIVTTPVSVLVVGHIYTVFGGVATDTVVYNGVTYTVGQSFTADRRAHV